MAMTAVFSDMIRKKVEDYIDDLVQIFYKGCTLVNSEESIWSMCEVQSDDEYQEVCLQCVN